MTKRPETLTCTRYYAAKATAETSGSMIFLLFREEGENSEEAFGDGSPTAGVSYVTSKGVHLPCRRCAVGLRSGQVKPYTGVNDAMQLSLASPHPGRANLTAQTVPGEAVTGHIQGLSREVGLLPLPVCHHWDSGVHFVTLAEPPPSVCVYVCVWFE